MELKEEVRDRVLSVGFNEIYKIQKKQARDPRCKIWATGHPSSEWFIYFLVPSSDLAYLYKVGLFTCISFSDPIVASLFLQKSFCEETQALYSQTSRHHKLK